MDEAAQQKDIEVIKHSAAIQIRNNISLLQRKAWNVLLYHAYDELPARELHSMEVRELKRYLGFHSQNEEYLKEALRAMVGCQIEWNVLRKDGTSQWGVSGLLASAMIENGICEYAFSPHLRSRLYNPNMYAKISLSLQNRFDSKYAQALWELCVDYLGAGRETGETPYIPIEQFRKLMGAENNYSQYKSFSQWVLRPALREVNQVSDLRVKAEYQRKGRKVVALKFKIRRAVAIEVPQDYQPDLFPETTDAPVVHQLKAAGVAADDAWEVWQKGFGFVVPEKRPLIEGEDGQAAFLHYVREKIHLLELRQKSKGGVANPSGFLLQAIRQNYGNPQFEKEQEARRGMEKMQRLRSLEKTRENLVGECDAALQKLSDEIVLLDGMADKAMAALKAQGDMLFLRWYEEGKSALENYRASRGMAVMVGKWLEGAFSEQFAQVRSQYDRQLAKLDKEIAALQAQGITTKYLS